ncbi:uncharacterized protein LOC123707732 isoform X1 [Pieris brassicae]|uniref:uncharacterized protein LOC123707732 isoform X1 n=1 Tax=Pieris brassicae TaxID=7116 RepID=UPI001E65FA7A|nr:uncharacterized protein LOC123707732 isoform X1 [Pieris brassicae]
MLIFTHFNLLVITSCAGYAEFEQFPGFDETKPDTLTTTITTSTPFLTNITLPIVRSSKKQQYRNMTSLTTTEHIKNMSIYTTTKRSKFKCPKEGPTNFGVYEVPTQRDLALMAKNILLNSYDSYNQQSMLLLKDIKEATKAALAMESKCLYNKQMYAKCVKIAGKQCERYTKDSLANLEAQRLDVLALTEDRICNLSDMTADPLHLIKLIAQERATLDFALPGFLILLNNCSAHCIRSNVASKRKPLRHMTDQDLVIRHILTKKNYIQLINDSKHKA